MNCSSLRQLNLFALVATLLLSNCHSNSSARNAKIERTGEPAIYTAAAADTEMILAAKKARATLPKFINTLQKHDSTAHDFSVKLPFNTDKGKEYIWLGGLKFENGKWYGTVDNTPEYTKQVTLGQKIAWDTSRVADWNFTSNDSLIGGYSIRLLRNRMSKEERIEFDKSTRLIIK